MSSLAGMRGEAGMPGYVATKFGVRGLTKAAALDLARYGIRVNSIHPGIVRTPLSAEGPKVSMRHVAMNRIGEPIEIANLTAFLASDDSSFSTGAELHCDQRRTRRPDSSKRRATQPSSERQEVTVMSDHFSGPAVISDPSVDITDFYAFPSPERPEHFVLIMDVFPMATAQASFSDVVTHRFRLRPVSQSGGSFTYGAEEYMIESPSVTHRKAACLRRDPSSPQMGDA